MSIKLQMIGTTQAAFEYIGIQAITATGTAKGLFKFMYFSKNQVGTNQCISHQIATQTKTYGIIFQIRSKESFITFLINIFQIIFCFSIFWIQVFLAFKTKSAISLSSHNFQTINPHNIQRVIQVIIYIAVILIPKTHINIAIATSLTNGEVIKKAKVIHIGIQAFRKPTKSGIEEQEQKGVIAQKVEAKK